jgi:hypothetical protein
MAKKGITWSGFLLRFTAAIVLVFTTYNPEGYSYYHWVKDSLPAIEPLMIFAAVILLIGWTIYLRATARHYLHHPVRYLRCPGHGYLLVAHQTAHDRPDRCR